MGCSVINSLLCQTKCFLFSREKLSSIVFYEKISQSSTYLEFVSLPHTYLTLVEINYCQWIVTDCWLNWWSGDFCLLTYSTQIIIMLFWLPTFFIFLTTSYFLIYVDFLSPDSTFWIISKSARSKKNLPTYSYLLLCNNVHYDFYKSTK